jgi:hypothetical protein
MCGCPASGRQLRIFSTHWVGTAARPYTAPRSAPVIAAFVSVSPPRIDGIHHPSFQVPSMQKLPQRVAKGDQNPSLLVEVIAK